MKNPEPMILTKERKTEKLFSPFKVGMIILFTLNTDIKKKGFPKEIIFELILKRLVKVKQMKRTEQGRVGL